MSDDAKNALAKERERDRAMTLWEQGARAEAAVLYADACVLSELGRDAESLSQYQAALEAELRQGAADDDASGALARLQVGTQALKMGDPALARAIIAPSLGNGSSLQGLLGCVEAEAQWALGAFDEARAAACAALESAASEAQKSSLREQLAPILGGRGDAGTSG